MFHIEGYEWAIYGLSLLSIMLLGIMSGGTKLKGKFISKTQLVKKICLAVFVVTSIYWIITFPFVGSYYSFPDKSDYPANVSVEKQFDYTKENHRRIEILERELQETRDELKAFAGRVNLILQLIMYGLIYFGASRIFSSNKKDSEENKDTLRLNL
jgi:hypothetical protein